MCNTPRFFWYHFLLCRFLAVLQWIGTLFFRFPGQAENKHVCLFRRAVSYTHLVIDPFYELHRHGVQGRPLFTRHCPKNGQKKKERTSVPYAGEILRFLYKSENLESPRPLRRISPMPCGERNGKSPAGTGFAAYSRFFLQRPGAALPVLFSMGRIQNWQNKKGAVRR